MKTPNAANRLVSLKNLTNLLPELVNNILDLYVRSASFTVEQLPDIAFSESTIRFAKLLTVVQLSYGVFDDRGLQHVVLGGKLNPPRRDIPEQMSPFLSKSDIAAVAFRAFPNASSEAQMLLVDRVTVLAGLGSVLSELGFHRKKAFVLRELLSYLLPALVQSRKDGAAEMGVHPAASLISADTIARNTGLEGVVGQENSEQGLQGFLALICKPYGVAGSMILRSIDDSIIQNNRLQQTPEQPAKSLDDLNKDVALSVINQATSRAFGANYLKIDILRSCISVCEALPDLGGVVRFSADLLRTAGSGIAPGPDSGNGSPALPVEDQIRLVNNITRTSSIADQLGFGKIEAEYWDNFLVRDIEALGPAPPTAPTPRSKNELEVARSIETQKEKSPFIFSSFTKKQPVTSTKLLLLADEEVEFIVTLQNLYEFDIEVEWLTLEHSGVPLDFSTQGMVVGPYRTQTMQLFGTPKSPGSLKITGCIAKIKGCKQQRFPVFSAPWAYKPDKKIKRSGLNALMKKARPVSVASDVAKGKLGHTSVDPASSSISLKVISHQPNIIVKQNSFAQSAVMLLEGEKRIHTITLQNLSEGLPIDLLLVSFSDSTTAIYQSSLNGKDLSAAELYEVELSAMHRQPLRWRREKHSEEPFIPPSGEITLEIEVLGQPGLSYGNVQVDYGYIGVPKSEIEDVFYTRQVNVPITVTVNASVELARNDFLPFTSDFAWANQQHKQPSATGSENSPQHHRQRTTSRTAKKAEKCFQSLLSRLGCGSQGDDHCLFLLDLHNSWPSPLSITIQVRDNVTTDLSPSDPWKRAYSVHEVLQPGRTSRLVLLLPRISISNPFAPIPSLNPSTKRQYVVGASKQSPATELESRETFWYREEILKMIRGTWEEDSSNRRGEIDFRSIRLSPRMVDAVRLEDIAISMTVTPNPDEDDEDFTDSGTSSIHPVRQLTRNKFTIPTSRFLTLKILIQSRLPQPIHPLLRLQPSLANHPPNDALDLGRKFAWHGLLQQALPLLAPGEVREVELGFCVLCKGDFEIGACVEETRVWKPPTTRAAGGEGEGEQQGKGSGRRVRANTADDDDLGRGEGLGASEARRTWHARESCLLRAVDWEEEMDSS